MQFTEVSELNADINAMRVGVRSLAMDEDDDVHQHYTSPVYHDKDSEITKLLNGSPPLESFFTAADYHPTFLSRTSSAPVRRGVKFSDEKDEDEEDEDEDEDEDDESDSSEEEEEEEEEEEDEDGNQDDQEPEKASDDEKSDESESANNDTFNFKRAPVPGWDVDVDAPITDAQGNAKMTFSGISALLGPAGSHSTDTPHAAVGPQMELTVYLPDRSKLELLVPKASTVEASIQLIVKHIERQNELQGAEKGPKSKMRQARFYELRLHDEDGMPDEDFPALENNGDISNFWDEDEPTELCLCEVLPTSSQSLMDEAGGSNEMDQQDDHRESSLASEQLRRLEEAASDTDARVLKVYLPDNGQYSIVQVAAGLKAYELLATVQSKQRLPLFKEEYQFYVSDEDKERVGLDSSIVQLDSDVHALGVRKLELRKRRYADAPGYVREDSSTAAATQAQFGNAVEHAQKQVGNANVAASVDGQLLSGGAAGATGKRGGTKHKRSATTPNVRGRSFSGRKQSDKREDPDNFLFNDLTSAVYEEWNVVKTNKWGKRQRRVLGIDNEKIFNKHRVEHGKGGKLSNLAVKRAERRIVDVISIQQVETNPSAFSIYYREGKFGDADRVSLEYEAEAGPAAAALIVAKIKHNLNRLRNRD